MLRICECTLPSDFFHAPHSCWGRAPSRPLAAGLLDFEPGRRREAGRNLALSVSSPRIRYEPLEELAQVGRQCRHMEAMRFQEKLVDALAIAAQAEPNDTAGRFFKAIGRGRIALRAWSSSS